MRLVAKSLRSEYLRTVNDEGVLIQIIELLETNREYHEAKYLKEIKECVSVSRLHMKAQLKESV